MLIDEKLLAVKQWIETFVPIQTKIIAKLMKYEPELWHEVTQPYELKRVTLLGTASKGLIVNIDGDIYTIKIDGSDALIKTKADGFRMFFKEPIPSWPVMWTFSNERDNYWLENENGIFEMSKWGFRIFKHDELGFYFGVKKVQFDFYTDYWIPLYESRGLDCEQYE